jgi:hypothetical protein
MEKNMTGTIAQNIMSLTKSEQEQLFSIVNDHADLLSKVIPQVPLLEYITTGVAIDSINDPLIQAYKAWKSQK